MSPDSHHNSWEVGRKKKRPTRDWTERESTLQEEQSRGGGGVQTEKSSPSDRFALGSKLKASTIPGRRISTWSILGQRASILGYCPSGIVQKTSKLFTTSKDLSLRKWWASRWLLNLATLPAQSRGWALVSVRTRARAEFITSNLLAYRAYLPKSTFLWGLIFILIFHNWSVLKGEKQVIWIMPSSTKPKWLQDINFEISN